MLVQTPGPRPRAVDSGTAYIQQQLPPPQQQQQAAAPLHRHDGGFAAAPHGALEAGASSRGIQVSAEVAGGGWEAEGKPGGPMGGKSGSTRRRWSDEAAVLREDLGGRWQVGQRAWQRGALGRCALLFICLCVCSSVSWGCFTLFVFFWIVQKRCEVGKGRFRFR